MGTARRLKRDKVVKIARFRLSSCKRANCDVISLIMLMISSVTNACIVQLAVV